ncbi:MAG: type II toxin-antitoxin system VapC family toxin [Candidatus Sericytochromatia bacterium]|nr:type II toxin-antitoxin system VapC family toxin [Candidatus Sericytochromatia bacterium]
MYLLDTNICIYIINQKSPQVLQQIRSHLAQGLFISSLTVAELAYGVENSQQQAKNKLALLNFLTVFQILNFEAADAVVYGELKARLKQAGKLIGPIDMLLAAQALRQNLVFVSNNLKEFQQVQGLILEDWSR